MLKRTLLKKVHKKSHKAITFKTALIIVLGLHAAAYFGFVQWSSHRAKQARIARSEALQKRINTPTEHVQVWPEAGKPKVVAYAKPKTQNVTQEVNTLLDSFNKVVDFTASQRDNLTTALSRATSDQQKQIADILSTATTTEQKRKVAEAIKSALQPQKSTATITAKRSTPIQKPKILQTLQKKQASRIVDLPSVNKNGDIVISPSTATTYVADGIHYVTTTTSRVVSSQPILY
jgi:hypothetical protein